MDKSIRVDVVFLTRRIAGFYGIDSNWILAIIEQESAFNQYAIRYEPNYKYLYHPERYAGPLISLSTEIQTQKISWGLGQLMGALAREQGHTGFMAELINPELNVQHIAIRLAALKKRSSEPEYIFAGYNGGPGAMRKLQNGLFSNQSYVNNVNQYMSKLV